MSRIAEMAVAAGLSAVLLWGLGVPVRAALTEGGGTAGAGSPPVMLAQAPAAPGPNVESNIAQLHQRLAITPAQEPQFQTLANIMRENARMIGGAPPINVNAVEGLRLAIQYGQQEIEGMRRMLPALQALYAVLTPAQRQAADQAFRQGPGE
jgi:protein CpxP